MDLLSTIWDPSDLRKLCASQLPTVAQNLRQFMLESLNLSGGHLGASLGTVELAIALHYVFNTPDDRLIWDVGHQAYPHKILTGRREQFHTLRKKNGLAPFLRREESLYDAFGAGHSSTSISAALGMALANPPRKSVAVIGDGAMTAGMAFEALNHAGDLKADLLVVLNDNDMSISGNVGALSNYFGRLKVKGLLVPRTMFEELGFNYIGPIDGHDLNSLLTAFNQVKDCAGPQLVHTITRKGKGYAPAEADPIKYHGVSKGFYHKQPPQPPQLPLIVSPPSQKTFSDIFGDWLCEMALADPRVVGITPAMCEGSGLVRFAKTFPDRYFDVGIAEQHSVTLAAGLACEKMKPVVAIYSTFLQRAYDQLIHDVALQNLPVLFAIDRAGLVNDGPTHSGTFDLSFLSCIPNMIVMAPSDANECRQMLYTGLMAGSPAAVRYPRGTGPQVDFDPVLTSLPIGKGRVIQKGNHIALLCFGTMLHNARLAAEKLGATLVDMRFVKPLDHALILEMAKTHSLIVTVEENALMGGVGQAVCAYINQHRAQCPETEIHSLGIPDFFIEHAQPEEMLMSCGLDPEGILTAIQEKVSKPSCNIRHSALESPDQLC